MGEHSFSIQGHDECEEARDSHRTVAFVKISDKLECRPTDTLAFRASQRVHGGIPAADTSSHAAGDVLLQKCARPAVR